MIRCLFQYLSFCFKRFINLFSIFDKNYKDRNIIFQRIRRKGLNTIPIFIISYNRLSYLSAQIESFEKHGLSNIIIIDNGSSYQPLLDYYSQIPYQVIYNENNDGYMVFWKNERYKDYRKDFYIITDPDIVLTDDCPNNILEIMLNNLEKYRFVNKVGVSLKIDDIPDNSIFGDDIKKWEKAYYKIHTLDNSIYYAPIDTTFALYLPDKYFNNKKFYSALRLGYPYQAKHLPWYKLAGELSDEDIFYSSVKTNGWWDPTCGKMIPDSDV